jgi:hypothetical protein
MRSFFCDVPSFTGPSFIGFQLLVVSNSRMTGGRGSQKFLLWE